MMRFTSGSHLRGRVCGRLAPPSAAQGVLVVETSTVNGTPRTTQVQIEPTRMRTEIAGQNGTTQVVIFDGGKQILYMIDPAAKTYSEMTKAEVDAAGAQMGDMMAQMQKALEGLPPAQRAQMEAMMKGRMGAMPGMPRRGRQDRIPPRRHVEGRRSGPARSTRRSRTTRRPARSAP